MGKKREVGIREGGSGSSTWLFFAEQRGKRTIKPARARPQTQRSWCAYVVPKSDSLIRQSGSQKTHLLETTLVANCVIPKASWRRNWQAARLVAVSLRSCFGRCGYLFTADNGPLRARLSCRVRPSNARQSGLYKVESSRMPEGKLANCVGLSRPSALAFANARPSGIYKVEFSRTLEGNLANVCQAESAFRFGVAWTDLKGRRILHEIGLHGEARFNANFDARGECVSHFVETLVAKELCESYSEARRRRSKSWSMLHASTVERCKVKCMSLRVECDVMM